MAFGAWEGTWNASAYGNSCFAQSWSLGTPVSPSEDCLFVNVFTPSQQICNGITENIPVLIFIHGGSFTEGNGGDSLYGPNRLLNKCLIYVTMNYRLGMFGFLSIKTTEISGNMGLKDQKMSIQWVKDNIAAFGGDPDKITVMGQSAGK